MGLRSSLGEGKKKKRNNSEGMRFGVELSSIPIVILCECEAIVHETPQAIKQNLRHHYSVTRIWVDYLTQKKKKKRNSAALQSAQRVTDFILGSESSESCSPGQSDPFTAGYIRNSSLHNQRNI